VSIPLHMIVWMLIIHYLADFIFQTPEKKTRKSKSIKWLGLHCFAYTGTLLILMPMGAVMFAVVNGLSHYIIDYFTSRITSRLYEKKKYNTFFNTIGFDQLLHTAILMLTYCLYFG
jgi:hypothetical protein